MDHHTPPLLLDEERQRYQRHLMLPEIGEEGQLRLKRTTVTVVGAGGLGSPVLTLLVASGIGEVRLIDHDVVETSNLQRQVIHGTASVGKRKVESAVERLHDLNPHVTVVPHPVAATRETLPSLVEGSDVVVDAVDNFATRYLINDVCIPRGIPVVWAAISQWAGQASVWGLPGGPCLRCVFPDEPAPGTVRPASEFGVFGVVPGLMGTIQAAEVIKLVTGAGTVLNGMMVVYDALAQSLRQLPVRRCEACPTCAARVVHSDVTAP